MDAACNFRMSVIILFVWDNRYRYNLALGHFLQSRDLVLSLCVQFESAKLEMSC